MKGRVSEDISVSDSPEPTDLGASSLLPSGRAGNLFIGVQGINGSRTGRMIHPSPGIVGHSHVPWKPSRLRLFWWKWFRPKLYKARQSMFLGSSAANYLDEMYSSGPTEWRHEHFIVHHIQQDEVEARVRAAMTAPTLWDRRPWNRKRYQK